jgi:hypothetical protein
MIESAQATLGGIKENSQSSKVPKQNWGAWRKIQKIWAFKKKKTNMMMLDQVRNEEKEPKPNTGGTIDHLKNNFKWKKVKKQAQVILSLEIP